jgi:hypothetical protein
MKSDINVPLSTVDIAAFQFSQATESARGRFGNLAEPRDFMKYKAVSPHNYVMAHSYAHIYITGSLSSITRNLIYWNYEFNISFSNLNPRVCLRFKTSAYFPSFVSTNFPSTFH